MAFLLRPKPEPPPTEPPPTEPPPTEPPPTEPSSQPSGKFLFIDDYEDNPTITRTTHDLWTNFTKDARNGNYWGDNEYWLEVGKIEDPLFWWTKFSYKIDPLLGDAKIVDATAHEGKKSVEITIVERPPKDVEPYSLHYSHGAGLARYVRNPVIAKPGVYEVGAWFYVPEGNTPYFIHVAMEDHIIWNKGYYMHAGVNPETNEIVVWTYSEDGYVIIVPLTEIDFHYNVWFKLWIRYDTSEAPNYEVGYKSPKEEKNITTDKLTQVGGMAGAFKDLPAFNFYAGALNIPGRPRQRLYVDDFYAKVVD
jgi:hypothetical protein